MFGATYLAFPLHPVTEYCVPPERLPFVFGARPCHFHGGTALGVARGKPDCFEFFLMLFALRGYRVTAPRAPYGVLSFGQHIPSGLPSALVSSDASKTAKTA